MGNELSSIVAFLESLISGPEIIAVLTLVAADVLLAVAAAMRIKEFDWLKLFDFYRTQIGPYFLVLVAASLLAVLINGEVVGPWGNIVDTIFRTTAWYALLTKQFTSIMSHLASLGIELPTNS